MLTVERLAEEKDVESGPNSPRVKSWLRTSSEAGGTDGAETQPNTSVYDHRSIKSVFAADTPPDTYRCQICFEHNPMDQAFRLACSHPFCRDCIVNYLFSKITEGQVYPTCFYIDEKTVEAEPATTPAGNANMNKYHTCGAAISTDVIESLLSGNQELYEKYKRFKFSKENRNARECPFCASWNVADAGALSRPGGGRIVCSVPTCGKTFCFYHANAHDFDVYATCAEYDAAVAPQQQASVDFIVSVSKACPGCEVMVMKSGTMRTTE
jgi:hypothetical protein